MVKIRIPILVLLFATAAVLEAGRLTALSAISGADVWWHLSSGLWILTNHALPHRGVFSQAGGTWIAASWAYDLLLGLGYKLLGLRGRFWTAVGLSAVVQYILGAVPPGAKVP